MLMCSEFRCSSVGMCSVYIRLWKSQSEMTEVLYKRRRSRTVWTLAVSGEEAGHSVNVVWAFGSDVIEAYTEVLWDVTPSSLVDRYKINLSLLITTHRSESTRNYRYSSMGKLPLTNQLRGRGSFWEPNRSSASQKKFPALYGTRWFVTAFARASPVRVLGQIGAVHAPPPPIPFIEGLF
jgi:hypothetical protein